MLSMISEQQTMPEGKAADIQKVKEQSPPQQQKKAPQTASKAIKTQPEKFYHAIRGKDLESLIYIDLKYGRVVIELLPDLAPIHAARMKELSRGGFYNGLTFHRVQKNFVAETGDPTGTGTGGSGKLLKAEISKEAFVRGAVGMKHSLRDVDSADSQFFIIMGPAPHLDGKYTLWGRVIYGMEFVELLKPGAPAKEPDIIQKMRVAADVKEL